MNTESYWQQFTNSGRIEDYLSYSYSRNGGSVTESDKPEDKGENPYAGTGYSNGHDTQSDAYG